MNTHRNIDERDLADCIGDVDVLANRDFIDDYLVYEMI